MAVASYLFIAMRITVQKMVVVFAYITVVLQVKSTFRHPGNLMTCFKNVHTFFQYKIMNYQIIVNFKTKPIRATKKKCILQWSCTFPPTHNPDQFCRQANNKSFEAIIVLLVILK